MTHPPHFTTVVNIKNSSYDQYIGRAGHGQDGYFGNPYRLNAEMNPGDTLNRYRKYFYDRLKNDPEFKDKVLNLKGKVLGCFCKPNECHGYIIAEYLNGTSSITQGILFS